MNTNMIVELSDDEGVCWTGTLADFEIDQPELLEDADRAALASGCEVALGGGASPDFTIRALQR